jgi:hypothetical protein
MLTGSVASAAHGAMRTTLDIDFVIDPMPAPLRAFVQRMLDAGFYASREAADEALSTRTMFNIINGSSGWKADLIVRKDRPFSQTEFERRAEVTAFCLRVPVVSVEDLIVAKLEWAKLGGSARQLEDERTLVNIAGENFDRAYLLAWIERMSLQEQWRRVLPS